MIDGFVDMTSNEDVAREDAALLVRFELRDVDDPEETLKNGYPCFKQREFVCIRIPGSREERIKKVTVEHKRRFPRAWAAYQAGLKDAINGTPLKECAVLSATEVSMFNHHGVMAVEQAVALSDENIGNMGHGIRPAVERIKTWWESRKSQKPLAEMKAQIQQRDELIAQMSARLAALEAATGVPTLSPEAPTPALPKPKRVRSKPKPVAQG